MLYQRRLRRQTTRLRNWIRKRRRIMIFIAIVLSPVLIIYNMKFIDQTTDKAKKTCKGLDCTRHSPVNYSSNLLLVLIYSSIDGSDTREVIRSTWTSMLDNSPGSSVQYRFVLGGSDVPSASLKQLQLEANKHRDLLILDDVTNSYYALTNRTISAIKYVVQHNYNFSYLLKCDDDTFVDLQQVCEELQNRTSHTRLYWGRFIKGSVKTEGKFKEPQWTTADDYFPYGYGGGYIISKDLADVLAHNEPFLMRYKNEDVSVGAWLAPYNVERKHDARFNTATPSLRLTCSNMFLLIHQVKRKSEMYSYHKSLVEDGVVCGRGSMQWISELIAHPAMYRYDWTAKPSQCCRHSVMFLLKSSLKAVVS